MMMTEVPGMGSEIATSPGTKGKSFCSSGVRQRSSSTEDNMMTTFINNNNKKSIVEDTQRTSTSTFGNNNRSTTFIQEDNEEGGGHTPMDTHENYGDIPHHQDEQTVTRVPSSVLKSAEEQKQVTVRTDTQSLDRLSPGPGGNNEQKRGGQEDEDEEEEDEDERPMILDEGVYDDEGAEDHEGDSDKEEHRMTVREALMSRAYQAAAAKFGHGANKYSHSSQSGKHDTSPSSPLGFGTNGHSRSREHHRDRGDEHGGLHHHQGRHNLYSSSSHHSKHSSYDPEDFLKRERRSHPSSPVDCDLKPDSLGSDGGSVNGLGNALLNLASLGGLAAFQQSIPNFMANLNLPNVVGGHSNAPLNLTQPNARDILQSRASPQSIGNPSSNPLIASAIANFLGGNVAGGTSSGSSPPQLGGQGSIPQLVLASGQLGQGIQGAQVLIPTSQGLMTQTVLTIPITQPGSSNLLNSSIPSQLQQPSSQLPIPNVPAAAPVPSKRMYPQMPPSGFSLSSRNLSHPQSPNFASATPQRSRESTSPDFPHDRSRTILGMTSSQLPMGAHMPTIPEKLLGYDHHHGSSSMNGMREIHGGSKKERESCSGGMSLGGSSASLCPPKSSPCSASDSMNDHDSDRFSDGDDDQMVDGINLDEIKEFAKAFKLRRLSLGLTQTQVGQALSVTEGPAYSQSAICSALAYWQAYPSSVDQQSMFEKLDITPKSAQKIKPVLERWMKEAEERYKNGHQNLNEFVGMEPSKKRKRRTSFTPQALEILNNHFERNTHPSGAEITTLAHQLGYEREVIRIWFCNKRQALKNTVRMMSKGSSPM